MKESGIKREYCRSPVKPPSKNVWSKLEFHERAHFLRRHLTISNPAAHILACEIDHHGQRAVRAPYGTSRATQ